MTRALYRSVAEIDNTALLKAFASRVDAATTTMLASARNAKFTNLEGVNLTLVTVIFGTVRNAFERGLSPTASESLQRQLVVMCSAYLEAMAEGKGGSPGGHPEK